MKATVKDANYARVMITLDNILREHEGNPCCCSQCLNSVVATALNCMAPHYYTDPKWNDHAGSPWGVIEAAVREALMANPGHRGACVGGTVHGKTGR